jgi:hypothetical protein
MACYKDSFTVSFYRFDIIIIVILFHFWEEIIIIIYLYRGPLYEHNIVVCTL